MSSDVNLKTPPKLLKCTVEGCDATFAKNRSLTNHIRKHNGERPFVCDVPGCDKTYTNSSHLRRHKKVSHEKVDLKVECSHSGCNKTFSNVWNMKRHCLRSHNKNRYPFQCSRCEESFKKKWQLTEHGYKHTGEMPFSCDKCDLKFARMTELTKHKRNHKAYPCACGRVFHRWSIFLDHRKCCIKLKPKCEICSRLFSTKQNLKQHMCIHEETRNKNIYLCIYKGCSRYYFYKRNLIFHINVFHKKKVKKIPCMYFGCDKMLSVMNNLKKHMAVVHQKKAATPKKPRKPRKDKGIPKHSTAGKLIGISEPLTIQIDKEAASSVLEDIRTFQDDIFCN